MSPPGTVWLMPGCAPEGVNFQSSSMCHICTWIDCTLIVWKSRPVMHIRFQSRTGTSASYMLQIVSDVRLGGNICQLFVSSSVWCVSKRKHVPAFCFNFCLMCIQEGTTVGSLFIFCLISVGGRAGYLPALCFIFYLMCIEEGTTASLLFHLLLDMCPGGNICLFVSSSFRYVPRREHLSAFCFIFFLICAQEEHLPVSSSVFVCPGGNICRPFVSSSV